MGDDLSDDFDDEVLLNLLFGCGIKYEVFYDWLFLLFNFDVDDYKFLIEIGERFSGIVVFFESVYMELDLKYKFVI